MDMRAALARATAELASAENDLHLAQERVDRLRTIQAGLELAVETYEHPLADHGAAVDQLNVRVEPTQTGQEPARQNLPGISAPSKRGPKPSHTDLAFAALKALQRPAATHEVRERDGAAGYPLSQNQVRNALTWLLRSGRVIRVAPGTWAIAEETPVPNDFPPAVGTAGGNQAGGNGPTFQGVAVPAGAGLNSQPAR